MVSLDVVAAVGLAEEDCPASDLTGLTASGGLCARLELEMRVFGVWTRRETSLGARSVERRAEESSPRKNDVGLADGERRDGIAMGPTAVRGDSPEGLLTSMGGGVETRFVPDRERLRPAMNSSGDEGRSAPEDDLRALCFREGPREPLSLLEKPGVLPFDTPSVLHGGDRMSLRLRCRNMRRLAVGDVNPPREFARAALCAQVWREIGGRPDFFPGIPAKKIGPPPISTHTRSGDMEDSYDALSQIQQFVRQISGLYATSTELCLWLNRRVSDPEDKGDGSVPERPFRLSAGQRQAIEEKAESIFKLTKEVDVLMGSLPSVVATEAEQLAVIRKLEAENKKVGQELEAARAEAAECQAQVSGLLQQVANQATGMKQPLNAGRRPPNPGKRSPGA